MSIREFHASTDLENHTFAAVQQLRSPESAPTIFEDVDTMHDWDPWG